MNPATILMLIELAFRLINSLYEAYKQIEGTQPIPLFEELLARNAETEEKIQAEKQRLAA